MKTKLEASIIDSALKQLIDIGVDIDNGIVPLIGDVDDEMYKYLVNVFVQMSNAKIGYNEVTIVLNTYGGETYHAFAIYDLLKQQEMSIRIVCNGPVMSAGTIILMSGDVREMSPLSSLMVHYGWNAQESAKDLEQNKRVIKQMSEIYEINSNATAKQIKSWLNHDTYFTAEEALKYGLVDKVREYAKKPKRKKNATRT